MIKNRLVIATRESPLALRQAELVKNLLNAQHPHLSIELLGMTTEADKQLNIPLTDIGGKGLFVKELEEALYDGRADVAVHSVKDVPMELPPGLCMPVMTEREDPRDAWVSDHYATLSDLPPEAILGTSSLRRQTQLRALRPDLVMAHLRGNINTRLRRLDEGEYAAIVLASAGLKRLGLTSRIRTYLSTDTVLPAAGQGALGLECRMDDADTQQLIAPLNHIATLDCVLAERALCRRLGGGCKVPTAAFAHIENGLLVLRGVVANREGSRILRATHSGLPLAANEIGLTVADALLAQGAASILREFNE